MSRATNPRFTGENFKRNLAIVNEVQAVAADAGVTPAAGGHHTDAQMEMVER